VFVLVSGGRVRVGHRTGQRLVWPVPSGPGRRGAGAAGRGAAGRAGARPAGDGTAGARLAVCVATFGVLRAAARRRPVLAVVDDLQWVDASSRECVEYAARRAGGSLAVVLAARDPWYPPGRAGLPELRVGPVDEAGAAMLLRDWAPGLAPAAAAAIAQAAAGNPLALAELPATLTAGQRAGTAALTLPLAPGRRLQRAFAGRVGALDPAARRALLIAAAYAGPDVAVVAAACQRAGTDVERLGAVEGPAAARPDAGLTRPGRRGDVPPGQPGRAGRIGAAGAGGGDVRGCRQRRHHDGFLPGGGTAGPARGRPAP
jgi:hypothetical protein